MVCLCVSDVRHCAKRTLAMPNRLIINHFGGIYCASVGFVPAWSQQEKQRRRKGRNGGFGGKSRLAPQTCFSSFKIQGACESSQKDRSGKTWTARGSWKTDDSAHMQWRNDGKVIEVGQSAAAPCSDQPEVSGGNCCCQFVVAARARQCKGWSVKLQLGWLHWQPFQLCAAAVSQSDSQGRNQKSGRPCCLIYSSRDTLWPQLPTSCFSEGDAGAWFLGLRLLGGGGTGHKLSPAAPCPAPNSPATGRLPAMGRLAAASAAVSGRRGGGRRRRDRRGPRCSGGAVGGAG